MCKAKMIEIPVSWNKEGQPDFDELGIDGLEPEQEIEPVCIDLYYLSRFNPYKGNTLIEVNGTKYDCAMKYNDFKQLYQKEMGVEKVPSYGLEKSPSVKF